jgi:hypothetical protein
MTTRKRRRLRPTEPKEPCAECQGHLFTDGADRRYCLEPSCNKYLLATGPPNERTTP